MTALRLQHSPKIVAPKCARAPFRSSPDERRDEQPDEHPRTVSSVQLKAYAEDSYDGERDSRDGEEDQELDHEIPSETIGVLDESDFEEVYEGGEFADHGLDTPPANGAEYADYAADPPHMDGAESYEVEVDIRAFEDAEAELPTCRTPLRTIKRQSRLTLEPTPIPPPAILRRSPSIPPPPAMVRPPSIPPMAAQPSRLPPPPQPQGALPSFDDPPVPYTPAAVPRDPATARYVVVAGCRTGELVLRALEPGEPPPYGTPIATLAPSCALDARTITMLLNR